MLSSDGQKRVGLRILGFPVRFSTTHSIDRSADFAPGKSHGILLHHPHLVPLLLPQNRTFPFDALKRRPSYLRSVLLLRRCADCDPGINRKIDFFFFSHSHLSSLVLLSASIPLIASADCRRCICSENIERSNNVARRVVQVSVNRHELLRSLPDSRAKM